MDQRVEGRRVAWGWPRKLARRSLVVFACLRLLSELVAIPSLWPPAQARDAPSRAVQGEKDVRPLELGKPIARELAGGESHFYQVTIDAGQYLRVIVDQQSFDLVLTLSGPDGQQFEPFDSRWDGPELVSLVAKVSGIYRLEVRAHQPTAARGRYEVRLLELRLPLPEDDSRTAAERISTEGKQLIDHATAPSLRQAREKYEEALRLWRAAGDRFGEAQALNSLGYLDNSLGQPQKALDHHQQALQLRQAIKDANGEGETIHNIAAVYFALGEISKSLGYYHQALSIRRATGNRPGEAFTLFNLGRLYFFLGESKKALDSLDQALPLFQAAGNRTGEVGVLSGLGGIYNALGEKQRALDYYHQALPLSRALSDRRAEATTLNNIGILYQDLGEPQKALEYYQLALPLIRAAADRRSEAGVLHNLGVASSLLGKKPQALDYYGQALAILRTVGDRAGEAQTLHGIGKIYDELGEKQRALDSYNQTLLLFRATGNRRWEAIALHNIGTLYASLDEKQQALDYYHQALQLWQAMSDRSGEASTRSHIARVESDRDNLSEARAQIEAALNIIESLRTNVASPDLRASYFASVRQSYEFYLDLLMRLHQRRPSERLVALALQASERARARSLLDLLAEAKIDLAQDIAPELKQRERDNQSRISSLNSQLIRANSQPSLDKNKIGALVEELRKAESEREQLEQEMRRKNLKYAEINYPTPLGVAAIQALLDDQTALLEYSLGQESSFLFVVSRDGIQSFQLPKDAEINSLVQEVRAVLGQPGRREFGRYARAARQLYELLIAPADDVLVKRRSLIIVPDGALHYLPFEALLTKEAGAGYRESPYLLKKWAISYAPSASVLASLRRPQPYTELGVSPKELVAFADPSYELGAGSVETQAWKRVEKESAPETQARQRVRRLFEENGRLELNRLRDSRREAAEIARFYPPAKTTVYLRQEAREENVKSNEHLSRARRLHFATHGLISERQPQASGLVLALDDDPQEDGLLQVYEIFNLKLRAELVVLSACQTGLGKELKGEGVIGLTRAFMYAGASSVVVSLWQVSDRSTADLMVTFYRHLNRASGKAEALRRAKLEMIESGHYAHPYYWAPFVLTGEPR